MQDIPRIRVREVINASRISSIQMRVFGLCFLIVAKDGFDTAEIGFLAPAIARDWKIAPHFLSLLFGAGMLGSVAGSAFFGPIADAFGRTRTLLLASAMFGALTLWASGVNDLMTLAAIRFFAGIGLGGVLPCAIALTSEYSPDQRRASLVTAMFCGFTLGSASGGIVAAWMMPMFGWRAVLAAGGTAPLVIALVGWRVLPESLNYLVQKGTRLESVRRTLARIAPGMPSTGWTLASEPAAGGFSARELFTARPVVGTLLLWVTAFMGLMVVYLLSNWMPLLLTYQGYSLHDASLITAMFQVGGTTGAILVGLLMDRFKPNRVIAITSFLAGAFVIAIGSLAHVSLAVAIAIFCAGFCIPGAQVGASAYAAAWYPTRVRATGVSWMSGMGKVGSMLGSVSGGGLLAWGFGMSAILALLAIPMTIAAVAMALHEKVRIDA